jgi:hypothetical protein
MQRSEMKKILGKFEKSTFCFFFCFGKSKKKKPYFSVAPKNTP